MKEIVILILSLFAASSLAANGQGKLQIGIKKRVEDCQLKTKKGHLVHIHYTVSIEAVWWSISNHKLSIADCLLLGHP